MKESQSLFKFFRYAPHDLDALANNYLWFSKYVDFNDPFEDVFIENVLIHDYDDYDEITAISFFKKSQAGLMPLHKVEQSLLHKIEKNTLKSEYIRIRNEIMTAAQEEYQELINNSRIACFAQNDKMKNTRAIHNRLMWSHYSDGLRGFCVEYDKDLLLRGIHRCTKQRAGYCDMTYGELKKHDVNELMINTLSKVNSASSAIGFGDLPTLKSSEWSYENEFRIMINSISMVNFNPDAIKSITVGCKMPEVKLKTLLSIIKANEGIKCDLNIAIIDKNNFEIVIKKLE